MIIKQLIIKNWKNFLNVDLQIRERVFFVGPNASGKSNLLDAFRFLRDISKPRGGGLQQAIAIRGGISKIRSLAARKNPLVEIEVRAGNLGDDSKDIIYKIGVGQENKGKRRVMVRYEKVIRGDKPILDRPNEQDISDDEQLTLTYLENPTTNNEFREIAELFGSISYLHLVPQLLRSVKSTDIETTGEDYYGRNFLVRVSKTQERTRQSRLRKIQEALSKAVPQFAELRDNKDDAGVPHLQMRLKHWRPNAGWQSEDQFSDGTIRMLGIFWSMQEGDSILLFEEPELSLNDKIVEQLPAILWKLQASKGRQVAVTTHSHALLSDVGIGTDEVFLLTPDGEGTSVVRADRIPGVQEMVNGGMSIGDAILPHTAPKDAGKLEM